MECFRIGHAAGTERLTKCPPPSLADAVAGPCQKCLVSAWRASTMWWKWEAAVQPEPNRLRVVVLIMLMLLHEALAVVSAVVGRGDAVGCTGATARGAHPAAGRPRRPRSRTRQLSPELPRAGACKTFRWGEPSGPQSGRSRGRRSSLQSKAFCALRPVPSSKSECRPAVCSTLRRARPSAKI